MTSLSLLPPAETQFFDANGNPLAGGKVYTYIPATTTPKATYQDQAATTPNTNPIVLDSAGRAVIWGAGSYRMQVYDAADNLLWDQASTTDISTINDGTYSGVTLTAPTLTNPKLQGYNEVAFTTAASGGSFTVDLNKGNIQPITLTADCALSITNVPASGLSGAVVLILIQDSAGSRTVTWPTGTVWPKGQPPTLSTAVGAVDVFTLFTYNGGTSWLAFISGLGMA